MPGRNAVSVMIEKFGITRGYALSEFLDLNQTSKTMIRVSLLIPKFARDISVHRPDRMDNLLNVHI